MGRSAEIWVKIVYYFCIVVEEQKGFAREHQNWGSSPSFPANNFVSGGRPNFSMHQNPPKNRETPDKERPIF
jgi:hypothetical protein